MNIDEIMYRFNIYDVNNESSIITEDTEPEARHLTISLLKSPDEFIKKNPSTKEITSPIFFVGTNKQPNPEGLLSNEIFGLTKEERSGIYGYIDLHNWFIHPLIYKKMTRMNKKIREVVHGTKKFTISSSGELVEDENGKTGIKWFKTNFSKIKFKSTGSADRDTYIKFIKQNEDRIWMNKLIVLPAYYRDVNTERGGKVTVGEINSLYASILTSVKGIKETEDYGIPVSDSINGRIQELLVAVYDWFAGNSNDALEGSTGLSKKLGIIRRSGQSKTADFGSRLVLSAPELKVETMDDMLVDIQHCSIPLASICANFEPYMIYHVKKFFENEFSQNSMIDTIVNGKVVKARAVEPQLQFSDEVIKEELKRYIHGYSNRLIPVEVAIEGYKKKAKIKFRGRELAANAKPPYDEPGQSELVNRTMTWCDIFYIAAVECTKDKHVLITRYPIDKTVA